MLNTQPIEKVIKDSGGEAHSLDVIKVWHTIQGEGPLAGHSAVFVRLAGCNMQCPLCDTDYTSGRRLVGLYNLVEEIIKVARGGNEYYQKTELVVLTGGEPLRQDIAPLCFHLWSAGFNVQIETNGTAWQERFENTMGIKPSFVCSPKGQKIHPGLAPHIDAYKYVIQAGFMDEKDGLPTRVLGYHHAPAKPAFWGNGQIRCVPIYIQPADEQDVNLNKLNMEAAVRSCLQFDRILCLQMHKYAGVE